MAHPRLPRCGPYLIISIGTVLCWDYHQVIAVAAAVKCTMRVRHVTAIDHGSMGEVLLIARTKDVPMKHL